MKFRRRTVLGGFAGGLAGMGGCTLQSDTENTRTSTPSPTTEFGTPENPPERTVQRARGDGEVDRHETIDEEHISAPGLRCGRTAAAAARDHVQETENTRGLASAYKEPTDEQENRVAVVIHVTSYRRDGTKQSEPSIGFDRLVEITPSTASATIEWDEERRTCTHPVYVERDWHQED